MLVRCPGCVDCKFLWDQCDEIYRSSIDFIALINTPSCERSTVKFTEWSRNI